MPVQPPTRQQLEWIADTLHMQLTEEELDVFEAAIAAVARGLPAPGRAARRAAAGQVSARGPRAPAGRRREPVQRLGVEVLDPGRRRRAAGRPDGRRQGQRLRGRHADAQRLADHGGLRAARGRDGRHAAARRRRAHRRQDRRAGVLLRRRRADRLSRPAAGQPAQPGVPGRLVVERQRGRGRRPARPTWRSAATRAARSGCRRRGAAAAGTSRRTASCPTPGSSRSS